MSRRNRRDVKAARRAVREYRDQRRVALRVGVSAVTLIGSFFCGWVGWVPR